MRRCRTSPRKKLDEQQGRYSGAAIIYARYSFHNQREVSVEQQVKQCQEFAQRNNLQVIEVYADRAIGGKTDNRPNFQRMMRDAEKKRFKYVIAWKSNRIGRNMLQHILLSLCETISNVKDLYWGWVMIAIRKLCDAAYSH